MRRRLTAAVLTVVLALSAAESAAAAGWQKNETGWWYATNDTGTTWYANGWQWIDGNGDGVAESYCFDANGYLYTNTTTPDGYTVNADGAWTVNGVVQTQAASQQSAAAAKPASGWYEEGGFWRYRVSGHDLEEHWLSDDGARYYFDFDGNMVTGFQNIDGDLYYFHEDGSLQTKTFFLDGMCYVIAGSNGIITDQIYEEDWYYQLQNQNSGRTDSGYSDVPFYSDTSSDSGSGSTGRAGSTLTDEEAYERIIAMKADYPEGMSWTNDNFYGHGFGCAGFAFLVQDTVFGQGRSRTVYDLNWSDIRVGDHLRVNNDTHSVIVLSVTDDSVTVCEGNYNSSIHWGRRISRSEVERTFAYRETRY